MADTSLIFDLIGRDKASAVLRKVSRSVKEFKSGVDETSRDISTLGKAMSSLGKPTALLAAAGAAVQLTAAVAPASQALLALPAAAGVGAAAMVTAKLATVGLGDALSAMAEGDAEAAREALAKIAPAARPAVRAMNALREEFGAVQQTVQANVFRNLAPSIQALGGTYIPILKTGLGGVATELGKLTKGAIATANTPFFQGAVRRTLAATTTSVANLSPAVNGLVLSLGALMKAGAPLIEQFTAWAGKSMQAAGAFLSSAEGAAWLRQKLDEGKRALLTLISITGNVRSALSGIFRAAGANNLLATIDRLTQKFATWANSVGGQQKLRELFTSLNEVARALIAALTQMAGPLGVVANLFLSMSPQMQKLVASSLAWSLMLGRLVSAFSPAIAVLGKVGGLFGKTADGADRLGLKLLKLGGRFVAMAAKATASMLRVAAVTIAQFARMAARAVVWAAVMAAQWLIAMGPIGWIIGAVIGLAVLIIANWDKIKKFTIAAWNAIVGALTAAWNFIKGLVSSAASAVVNFLRSAWNRAKSLVSSAWSAISNAVSNGVSSMIGFVKSIPGKILSALGNLGSLLWDAGRNVIQGLIDGIMSMIGAVGNAIGSVVSRIRGALPFSPAKWGPLRQHPPDEAGRVIGRMLASGISAQQGLVAAAASRLAGSVVASTRSPLQRAAANLLAHVRGGGNIFEDFSARGVNELGMNDRLAELFRRANPNFDFGAPGTRDRVEQFLAGQAAAGRQQRVQLEIRSGGEGLDELLLEVLRRAIRVQGGSVQEVLGS